MDIPSSESEVGDLGGDVGDDSSVLDSSSDSNLEHSVRSVGPGGGYTAEETPMELDGVQTTASVSNTHVNVGQVDAVGMHTSAVGWRHPLCAALSIPNPGSRDAQYAIRHCFFLLK